MKIDFSKLVGSVVVCQLAGLIGAVFTTPHIETWYVYLEKPWFNPPNWVFGPVWTILYTLMGIAVYIVWQKKNSLRKTALDLFFIQLVLNTLWSVVFFGMQNILGGLVIIAFMWCFILLTLVYFWRIARIAGWLLVPYLGWVSFASVLNYYLLVLN